MKLVKLVAAVLVMFFSFSHPVWAQERGTADEAKALSDKAMAHVKAVGFDKALADFSDKESGKWVNKDLYVVVLKFDGTVVAHGVNKGLIGKNMMDIRDPDGKFFTREMIEHSQKGPSWVDYGFTDPITKKIAPKSSYAVRIPGADATLVVGIYKK